MSTPTVVHAKFPVYLRFDDDGIGISFWPGVPVSIAWQEVEFVCPVPWIERGPEGWRQTQYPGFERYSTPIERSGRLALCVVVRDRRPVIERAKGRTRRWVRASLRAMLNAADELQPDQSLLELELSLKKLGGTIQPLFELLAAKSRFDRVWLGDF
jgi:hypothetical protein